MIYLRARYYDSSMGRFISADPHWNPDNMIYGDSNDAVKYIISAGYKYYYDKNNNVINVEEVSYNEINREQIIRTPDIEAICQSNNLYEYAINNPNSFMDYNGESVALAATAGVSAVLETVAAAGIILAATAAVTNTIRTVLETVSKKANLFFMRHGLEVEL